MTDQPDQPEANASNNISSPSNNQNQTVGERRSAQQADENGWHAEEREHKRQERTYWRIQKVVSAITLILSLIAAGGAAAGAYIAFNAFKEARRQADAAETQIAVAKDTELRQLRAYLSVTGVVITDLEKGKRPVAQITIKNAGQTPANHVRRWADPIMMDKIPAPNYVPVVMPTYPENSGTPVAPGGSLYITAFFDKELTDLEINAIKSKRYAMYVKGIVTYLDIFNVKRTTQFYVSFGGPGTGINAAGAMALMDEGNESD
jgi:hypothetical protein